MNIEYLKISTTIILAVIGWIFAHKYTSKRDVFNKKREIRIEHLINAYRTLAYDVCARTANKKVSEALISVLTDVQLFGSTEQIEMAHVLMDEAASRKPYNLDPLLNSLRNDLRLQLNLKGIDGNVGTLRVTWE